MQRVMIIGQPGSGKSTLARQVGALTQLPVIHIDHIHWKSGWVERSGPEKDAMCRDVHAQAMWVFEGGRSPMWPERLDRADTLIWLDLPLAMRAGRVFCRTLRHWGHNRPDLPDGCPERFDREFMLWIWNTRHSSRAAMQRLCDSAAAGKAVHHLPTRRQVRGFLGALGTGIHAANES